MVNEPLCLSVGTQTISAAGNAIQNGDSVLNLGRSGGALTMTSTPTISTTDVVAGQVLIICHTGGGTLTLQDEGTLSGSKLQLRSGSTYALAADESTQFVYVNSYWRQISD
jgi:hypothetical protein